MIDQKKKSKGGWTEYRKDYIEKTENILMEETKFNFIKGDWFKYIIALEDKLNRQLRKIKNKLTSR